MTPQQKLANRLYELLPHKKELEFGCEVWYPGCPSDNKNIYITSQLSKPKYLVEKMSGEVGFDSLDKFYIEIIGQPLRLADVLMAVEITNSDYDKSNRPYNIHLDFQATWIEAKHLLITHALGDPILNKEGQYNLSKDNILDQSDEFCTFVLELLTNPTP